MSKSEQKTPSTGVQNSTFHKDLTEDARELGSRLEESDEITEKKARYSELPVYNGEEVAEFTGYSGSEINKLSDWSAFSSETDGFRVEWKKY